MQQLCNSTVPYAKPIINAISNVPYLMATGVRVDIKIRFVLRAAKWDTEHSKYEPSYMTVQFSSLPPFLSLLFFSLAGGRCD
jgi:hypothetical protein